MRATLEAIAFEVRDVVDLMTREAGVTLPALSVDGGAAANGFLCQVQADQLGVPVLRSAELQATGLGAGIAAGLGTGVWASTDEVGAQLSATADARFDPQPHDPAAHRLLADRGGAVEGLGPAALAAGRGPQAGVTSPASTAATRSGDGVEVPYLAMRSLALLA